MKLARGLLLVPVAAVTACRNDQSALHPAGDQAANLMRLLSLMGWVCGPAYLAVLLLLGWSLWRARRATVSEADESRLQRLLILWIALVLLGLVILVSGSFLVDRSLGARPASAPLLVRITGHQWWWRIEYAGTDRRWIETANELHLPAGRPTLLELRAADVIHSFWVPNLAGKMDMIPGRINHLLVTPRKTGWFRGQCAEFCGLQHANMALVVKVEPTRAFDAWLAGQAQPVAPATGTAAGERLVAAGSCGTCHQIRGTAAKGRVGPDLTHIASRRSIAAGTAPLTRGSLRGWILQPQAMKPGTAMPASDFSPQDADAVARYLEVLR